MNLPAIDALSASMPGLSTPNAFVLPVKLEPQPTTILVGKAGLDGHDRGAKYVVRLLRDAGYRVIYSGIRRTPAELVSLAREEQVDAIGVSVLSGAHQTLFSQLIAELRARNLLHLVVFGGGIIPDGDIGLLQALGVAEVFTPGTPGGEILQRVARHVPLRTLSHQR